MTARPSTYLFSNTSFTGSSTQKSYYPFGMEMPGRTFTSDDYRYGFNGMEKDGEEWTGSGGNQLDFGARIYDSRLGRWLSTDPLANKYSGWSPYHFAANSPIWILDPNGKEWDFSNLQIVYDKENQTVKLTGEVTLKLKVLNLTQEALAIDDINLQDIEIPYVSFDGYLPTDLQGKPNIDPETNMSQIVRYETSNLTINVEATSVVSSIESVSVDDHVFIVAEELKDRTKENGEKMDVAGLAILTGNVASVELDYIDNHTPTHEVAHLLGTEDWLEEHGAKQGYLMSYEDDGTGFKLRTSDMKNITETIVNKYTFECASYCKPIDTKEQTEKFIERNVEE